MDAFSHAPSAEQVEQSLLKMLQVKCNPRWYADLRCCVPHLCELFQRSADWPSTRFEHAVRQVIIEHCQIDEGGDAVAHGDQSLDRQIHLILRELHRLRQECVERGDYLGVPVPPMMFG